MKSIIYMIILGCLFICACQFMKSSPCHETCEYSRRDCIQLCGDPNKAGFNMKLGGNWEIGSVDSCIAHCNKRAEECVKQCDSEIKVEEEKE